jgi:hypothetical protein
MKATGCKTRTTCINKALVEKFGRCRIGLKDNTELDHTRECEIVDWFSLSQGKSEGMLLREW